MELPNPCQLGVKVFKKAGEETATVTFGLEGYPIKEMPLCLNQGAEQERDMNNIVGWIHKRPEPTIEWLTMLTEALRSITKTDDNQ